MTLPKSWLGSYDICFCSNENCKKENCFRHIKRAEYIWTEYGDETLLCFSYIDENDPMCPKYKEKA